MTRIAIAGLLHDAAEDQGGEETLKKIRLAFGARVAKVVAGCTDTVVTPKPPIRSAVVGTQDSPTRGSVMTPADVRPVNTRELLARLLSSLSGVTGETPEKPHRWAPPRTPYHSVP